MRKSNFGKLKTSALSILLTVCLCFNSYAVVFTEVPSLGGSTGSESTGAPQLINSVPDSQGMSIIAPFPGDSSSQGTMAPPSSSSSSSSSSQITDIPGGTIDTSGSTGAPTDSSSGTTSGVTSGVSSGITSGASSNAPTDVPGISSNAPGASNSKPTEIVQGNAPTADTAAGSSIGNAPQLTDIPGGASVTSAPTDLVPTDEPKIERPKEVVISLPSAPSIVTTDPSVSDVVIVDTPVPFKETAEGTATQTETKTEETKQGPTVTITKADSVTEKPSDKSTAQATTVGENRKNDTSSRVSLDFSLISPAHSNGGSKVAKGSVQLSDGSWQDFGYKDNIHAPYYKMLRSETDSKGTSWFVAVCNANRFGNGYTSDGSAAKELWLLASDCTTKSYIDIPTSNEKRIAIVKAALSCLGKKYVYGGNGPDSYDCSGLVKYCYKQAGITVPRTSAEYIRMEGQVSLKDLRPGDICARNGHAGIYIGNNIFVHASERSVGVVSEYLSSYNALNSFTVYVNAVGD
ncbi:MAG: NlpC/P60 family protein [Eubacteriales bacterium]|nr:NlpC/P60 family protein [Eubacteriales bacterium]